MHISPTRNKLVKIVGKFIHQRVHVIGIIVFRFYQQFIEKKSLVKLVGTFPPNINYVPTDLATIMSLVNYEICFSYLRW